MVFETYVPAPPLNRFVEFLWFYDDFTPLHTKEKLLPDASMELIIDLREHPKALYDPDDFTRSVKFRRYWLSGMQRKYLVIDASPGSMMGAHFRTGGAWPFFGAPLREFSDQVVELDCVLGSQAESLRERLLEEPDAKRKLRCLEKFLLKIGGTRLESDRSVDFALEQIMSLPVRLLMRDLASIMGVSQKHLIHLFDMRVGMTPKQVDRVVRFQKVVKGLGKADVRNLDWSRIAVDCGYYDQPHFINDFRLFSGLTPSAFLEQEWDYTNFLIVDPPSATPQ